MAYPGDGERKFETFYAFIRSEVYAGDDAMAIPPDLPEEFIAHYRNSPATKAAVVNGSEGLGVLRDYVDWVWWLGFEEARAAAEYAGAQTIDIEVMRGGVSMGFRRLHGLYVLGEAGIEDGFGNGRFSGSAILPEIAGAYLMLLRMNPLYPDFFPGSVESEEMIQRIRFLQSRMRAIRSPTRTCGPLLDLYVAEFLRRFFGQEVWLTMAGDDRNGIDMMVSDGSGSVGIPIDVKRGDWVHGVKYSGDEQWKVLVVELGGKAVRPESIGDLLGASSIDTYDGKPPWELLFADVLLLMKGHDLPYRPEVAELLERAEILNGSGDVVQVGGTGTELHSQ